LEKKVKNYKLYNNRNKELGNQFFSQPFATFYTFRKMKSAFQNKSNTLASVQEQIHILSAKMEKENCTCALHNDQKLLFIRTKSNKVHLGCPYFPRCQFKIAFSMYNIHCHGCYNKDNQIQINDVVSMLGYNAFCNECAQDIIIQIIANWDRFFQVNFPKDIQRQQEIKCETCNTVIQNGKHVVQKNYIKGNKYFHFESPCSKFDDPDLNPNGELIDLSKKFTDYIDEMMNFKRNREESASFEVDKKIKYTFQSRLKKLNK
jgi:hypothetical protein